MRSAGDLPDVKEEKCEGKNPSHSAFEIIIGRDTLGVALEPR